MNDLITLENDHGPQELPADLTQAAETPQDAPQEAQAQETAPEQAEAPVAQETAPQPPQQPAEPQDPAKAGLLRELREERERRRQAEANAQMGIELAQKLQQRPDVLAMLQQGQQQQQTPAAPPQHELRELAESLALYDATGKPDIGAAQRVAAMMSAQAQQAARQAVEQEVAPLRQARVQDQATARYNEAVSTAQQFGIDPSIAQEVFGNVLQTSPSIMAEPATAAGSLIFAAGMQYLRDKGVNMPGIPQQQAAQVAQQQRPVVQQQRPAVTPPVVIDRGMARPTAPSISNIERQQMKRHNISESTFTKFAGMLTNMAPNAKSITLEGDD